MLAAEVVASTGVPTQRVGLRHRGLWGPRLGMACLLANFRGEAQAPAAHESHELQSKSGMNLPVTEEMIQQAYFHNMPLAFATAQKEPVDYYIPLNRQLQSLLYWWTPDTKFTLDNPSQVIFPPNSPSEYANQIFKTQRENVDLTNWAATWLKESVSERERERERERESEWPGVL